MAVSFDLFGTLVSVEGAENPTTAVAAELRERGVDVPADFGDAYREPHVDAPTGAEQSLPTHVAAALSSRGVEAAAAVTRRAVVDAFDRPIELRSGAGRAVDAAADSGPIGVCSNCSVPGLVERTLSRVDLQGRFDAVVTSVDCGWRKPDERIFEALAVELGVEANSIVHVGDAPDTDGGIESLGGDYVDVAATPLSALPERLGSSP